MTDDLPPGLRRLLNDVPEPPVRPVDVARIFAATAEANARSLRRWKRAAAGLAALAAGVLLAAVLPKLEVRADRGSFTVRWGPADPLPVDELTARLARLEAEERPDPKQWRELRELLVALSADVNDRDERTRSAVVAVIRRVDEFEAMSAVRWADADQTSAALYALSQTPRGNGGRP